MNLILERIKQAYHLETDAQLADFLGINASTLSMQKNRGRLNLQLIIEKCQDLNKNWLLHGKGAMWDMNEESPEGVKIPIYKSVDPPEKGFLKHVRGNEIGWLTANGDMLKDFHILTPSKNNLMGYLVSDLPVPPKLTKNDIAIINLANKNPEEGIYLTSRANQVACRRIDKDRNDYGRVLGKLVWVMQKVT